MGDGVRAGGYGAAAPGLPAVTAHARSSAIKPTAALFETIDRVDVAQMSGAGFLTSGTMVLTAIALPASTPIASISFISGTQALVAGTHGWVALYDSSLNLLRQSTDDTGVTWAANTLKTFTLSSSYTTTYAGLHYLGLLLTGGTMPQIICGPDAAVGTALGLAPILSGNSSTGLTGTAPNPAGALTAKAAMAYAYVS